MENNQYLTGFVQAISTVFESISGRQVNCSDIKIIKKDDCTGELSVVIGLIGDVNGSFHMTMKAHMGCKLASELLGGMEVNGVDELVTSAVSELGNMIMGNACSNISSETIQVDITPPSVYIGDTIAFSSNQECYHIPVEVENLGVIEFDVMLKSA